MSKISTIQSLEDKISKLEIKRIMIARDVYTLTQQMEKCELESEKLSHECAIDSTKDHYKTIDEEIKKLDDELKRHKDKEKQASSTEEVFAPFAFSELFTQPPKQWLIENILGKGDFGLVYGAPGCGKTFVVIDLIFALCSPGQWAGRFKVDRPLTIAYCAGEGFSGLPARFSASAQNWKVDNLPSFTFFKKTPQLHDLSTYPETIERFIREWEGRQQRKECESLDVLIIDTFHSATVGADENSSCDIGAIIQQCRLAIEKLNCAIIMVHHTTKDGASERGSSAIRGAMDFMIKVEKIGREDSSQGRIHCSKLKDGEPWKPQNFELIRAENQSSCYVQWDSPLPSEIISQSKGNCEKFKITQILAKNPSTGFTVKSISDALGLNIDYIRRLLIDMSESNIIDRRLSDPSKDSSNRNPWIYFHKI